MVNFLIRRLFYAALVLLTISFITYGLLYIAPGGPLDFLLLQQQDSDKQLNEADIDRLLQSYELDLTLPVRFSRWLIGWPTGPINIGGNALFANTQVGCLREGEANLVYPDGTVVKSNCIRPVYLSNLAGRESSRGILNGDFGKSRVMLKERPVSLLLASRVGPTLQLQGLATFLALLFAIPIGIYSAYKQDSKFDYIATNITFLGASLPTLFWGIMFILLFGLAFKEWGLPYLFFDGDISPTDRTMPLIGNIVAGSAFDRIWHIILPAGVLMFVSLAGWSRFIRASMLEVLRQDYVRTARSKGATERLVVLRHALRNALIPFITLVVGIIPGLFGGAVVTESIFSWPGVGRLFLGSLLAADYPVSMAIFWIGAVLFLIAVLLADILYTVVDPRIRLS